MTPQYREVNISYDDGTYLLKFSGRIGVTVGVEHYTAGDMCKVNELVNKHLTH